MLKRNNLNCQHEGNLLNNSATGEKRYGWMGLDLFSMERRDRNHKSNFLRLRQSVAGSMPRILAASS